MISCEVLRRHVDAFVDGEVDPDTHIEFEQHLASCGPCRVHLAFSRSMKQQVREACGGAEAPLGLAEKLRRSLDAEDGRLAGADPAEPIGVRPAEAEARVGPPLGLGGIRLLPAKAKYAVPAAAAAVALAFIAAQEGGNPIGLEGESSPHLIATAASHTGSVFEDIVRRHSSEHPAEVVGPPTTVASWFRGKLHFPVRPVRFSSPDVQLVGARISNVQDREAAAFSSATFIRPSFPVKREEAAAVRFSQTGRDRNSPS